VSVVIELTEGGGHARIRLGYSVNIVTAFSDMRILWMWTALTLL